MDRNMLAQVRIRHPHSGQQAEVPQAFLDRRVGLTVTKPGVNLRKSTLSLS